jgi:hypothetical protein
MKPNMSAAVLAAGLLLTALSGCVVAPPLVSVSVNSYASAEAPTLKRFAIMPGNKGVSEFDLDFLETKDAVEQALLSQGFELAAKPDRAQILVFVSYGIGLPQTHTHSYQMPVYGQIGGGTSRVNSTVITPQGISHVTGTITQQPVYGVTGYSTKTSTTTTYTRWLRVDAINMSEYLKTKSIKSTWDTRMVSIGTNGDLRQIIPVMLRAGLPYFGKTSGQTIQTNVSLQP